MIFLELKILETYTGIAFRHVLLYSNILRTEIESKSQPMERIIIFCESCIQIY